MIPLETKITSPKAYADEDDNKSNHKGRHGKFVYLWTAQRMEIFLPKNNSQSKL